MFELIENPFTEDHHILVGAYQHKYSFNSKCPYLLCMNKLYRIIYDVSIKNKNELQIKGTDYNIKKINVQEYNIKNTISLINIEIIDSNSIEINEKNILANIYFYLKVLFVFNKMEINIDDTKMIISFNAFDKYYLINDETKIIIKSKYKLYNYIVDINNEKLNYITFNIGHVYNSFKRDSLGDINLLNTDDFYQELEKNKNSLYIDKKFRIISNNCEFEAKVTFMNLVLEEEYNTFASETIYNFTDEKIKNIKVITDPNIFIMTEKILHYIQIIIENGPKKNHIYDLDKLTKQVHNLLKFNYVKENDKFKINMDEDILTIKVVNINDSNNKAYYINKDNNINFKIKNNFLDNIFAYEPELVDVVESMDVIITKYLSFKILVGGDTPDPEVNIQDVKNIISGESYFLYDTLIQNKSNFEFKYSNIIVKDRTDLNNFLLKINYSTKINIIKDENCNIKLIDNKLDVNINMTIDEIKNIKNKLVEYGLTGMDKQVDQIVREILLPRSTFIHERFKTILKLPKGIILYGPSGTGKTSLARNIAKIIGITDNRIKMLNGPEIFSKYLGESEKNIRKLFEAPRKDKKNLYLIIIDEVDSIFKVRRDTIDSSKSDVVNQFLGEMDGLDVINNIIIIGITNRLDMLDSAILRPGRFGCKIYCGLPNETDRLNIIKLYHNKIINNINFDDINFDTLVKNTEGFSGAQIEYIYVKIVELVIESIFNDKEITITNEIIDDIVKNVSHDL